MSKPRNYIESALKTVVLMVWALFPMLVHVQAAQPTEPYQHGQNALLEGELSEALRWFRITYDDFPRTVEGRTSLVQRALILTSGEISNAKLASLYREAAKLQSVEGSREETYLELSRGYEKKAKAYLEDLSEVLPLLEKQSFKGFALSVSVKPKHAAASKALASLEKGEWIETEERRDIQDSTYLRTYLGLLSNVCLESESSPIYAISNAPLQAKALFHSIGSRFFIAGQNFSREAYLARAKRSFEAVLELTKDSPYDKIRQSAIEFIDRIQREKSKGKKK